MDDRSEPRHRESPATYRRRRLTVGGAAAAVVMLVVLLGARLGSDVDDHVIETASAETATTAAPEVSTTASVTSGTEVPAASTTAPIASTTSPTTAPTSQTATSTAGVAGFSSSYEFLACVRARESRGNYAAVSEGGGFFGAYQIDQVTWDSTAEHAGLSHLRGIQPNLAPAASQDAIASALLQWQGAGPWAGGCIAPVPGT